MTQAQAEEIRAALVQRGFPEDAIQSAFVGLLEAEAKGQVIRDYVALAVTLAHRREVDAFRRVRANVPLAGVPEPRIEPEQLRRAEARQELRRLIQAEERATKTARVRR